MYAHTCDQAATHVLAHIIPSDIIYNIAHAIWDTHINSHSIWHVHAFSYANIHNTTHAIAKAIWHARNHAYAEAFSHAIFTSM